MKSNQHGEGESRICSGRKVSERSPQRTPTLASQPRRVRSRRQSGEGKPQKHIILFLAAYSNGSDRWVLEQEAHSIQAELERSGQRDCFELVTRWATKPLDLLCELRKLKPIVVHVSGHGGQNGLFFHAEDGRAQLVSTAALAETFNAAGASVKLVVLDACYSEAQSEALLAHVDCVVGISGSIHGSAMRSFAIGFYGGLGERESVTTAYKHGCAAINLQGLPGGARPQLKVREGVDATQLVLAATAPRR